MTGDNRKSVSVAITVTVDKEIRVFDVEGLTEGDVWDLAHGLFDGVTSEANRWIDRSGRDSRCV